MSPTAMGHLDRAPACRNNHWALKEATGRAVGPVFWVMKRINNIQYPPYIPCMVRAPRSYEKV